MKDNKENEGYTLLSSASEAVFSSWKKGKVGVSKSYVLYYHIII